jgi:predicted transcriptional regulator
MIKDETVSLDRCLSETSIASIVASFAARQDVSLEQIIQLCRGLFQEFDVFDPDRLSTKPPYPKTSVTALPVENAVTKDKVYCLCCGRGFSMLKRHIGSEHGMSEFEYRRVFSLAEDFPLVAPNYSKRKAEFAKRSGLGKHHRVDQDPI